MEAAFDIWLDTLRAKRQRWVDASHENDFDRGIWNATVEKYADPSHFIFELLQNAEDAGASWVRFSLDSDRIQFEHDGRPFDRGDIEGITGIGNTTKLDDGHKIGCFGIGFKSVYVITERPEVHSHTEGVPLAFAIENLVVPRLVASEHRGLTTRIVLPLRPDKAEITLERARDGLATSGPRSLLFLQNIKRLQWVDGERTGHADVSDNSDGIRSIRSVLPDGTPHRERFLILSRSVEQHEQRKQYEVKAALRMNDGGELIPEEAPTRLMVFFETQEITGLHFLIHGPFQLTDNRANIKLDDAWNAELIETLGALVADSLAGLRDRGLLKRGVMELLPNAGDELPTIFAPIRSIVAKRFTSEALIASHAGPFVIASDAIRGPAELRELLGDEGLAQFGGRAAKSWIVTGLRNSRTESFLTMLKIEEWGHTDFFSAFQRAFGQNHLWNPAEIEARKLALAWFDGLSDDYAQRFYLALDPAMKAQKRPVSVANLCFVRIEGSRRGAPNIALFPPADTALDPEAGQCDLYLVKNSLIRGGRGRGKDVEALLRRLGVKDVDEKAYLQAIIRTQYAGDGPRPNRERHLQHMRRFMRWWKGHNDVSLFAGKTIVRAGPNADYHDADTVYFGAAYLQSALDKVYDGSVEGRDRLALWDGYDKLKRKDLVDFLTECGVEDGLAVVYSTIPYTHPNWSELHGGFGATRHMSSGTNIDHTIEEIDALLARGDPAISRLIWDAVKPHGASAMAARFSPNASRAANTGPSSLAIALRDAAWVPAKDGTMRRPRAITAAELAAGFSQGGNEPWLQAIGFGEEQRKRSDQHKARLKAGELIGLNADLVEKLEGLPADVLAALNEDIARKLDARAYEQIEFPERETRDPDRRAARVAARAQQAPAKTYEVRERSVRTSNNESRATARSYLEDHYTTPLGDMICQACQKKMPFALPDGSPYFEASELLDGLTTEHAETHLAMCPVCAAKWRHANPMSDPELRALIASATAPEIDIILAGEPVRLRFTQVHLDDIRTVSGTGRPS
ncbi:hypothetical protein ASE90_05345 [Sphingomonas sp. Leaf67]|uniref:sacsin N-terminal ATP-binding-like domain-containing protein n=1 Tax=Sphingomonas sp. Leaf67 TaxID=1736230 RepID=UPI0006F90520|nr:hypothetical protein [Sphingomonas sp. Leaf67]KQN92154.1 hypothetical protein ASE90_05345 [Sphingomonas sp. Leaf67]